MGVLFCNIIALITCIYFTQQEYNQFVDNYEHYFNEFWNYIDISVFFIFYIYFCLRISDWRSFIPSKELKLDKDDDVSDYKLSLMVVLNITLLITMYIK